MKKLKIQKIHCLIRQYFTIFDNNNTVHYKYEFTIYSLNNALYVSLYIIFLHFAQVSCPSKLFPPDFIKSHYRKKAKKNWLGTFIIIYNVLTHLMPLLCFYIPSPKNIRDYLMFLEGCKKRLVAL